MLQADLQTQVLHAPPKEENRYDAYWDRTEESYPHYPTIRHRRRFILQAIRNFCRGNPGSVFDFGCGEGTLLSVIQQQTMLGTDQIGGCDISGKAVESARRKLKSPHLFHASFPDTHASWDVMVCCEVIEHTRDYIRILTWIYKHTAPGGILILTTQTGGIHASDHYTGHTQHFRLHELRGLLRDIGWEIEKGRLWGWPFFTIQKYLTNVRFGTVRTRYLEGPMTRWKSLVFTIAYLLYFVHDLILWGPQIYIVARKSDRGKHP